MERFILFALLVASCARHKEPPSPIESAEWTRVIDNPFEGSQMVTRDYDFWVTRIVDADSGDVVQGARLFAIDEHDYSVKSLPRQDRSAMADEYGIVRLRLGHAPADWAYVIAPGYAPRAQFPEPEMPVELRRGTDVRVRLHDPLGRPVAGAKVQYYLGCGHTPNSREPLTDSDGYALLKCVDPEAGILFPVGPGIGGSDIELYDVPASDGVRLVYADPGWIVEGTILEPDGTPMRGVMVGATTWNHGPWACTDDHGRFELVSVERYSRISVHRDPDDDEVLASFLAPPPGVPVTVHTGVPDEPTHAVQVHLSAPDEGIDALINVDVWAVRHSDGMSLLFGPDEHGRARLALPAGRWELRIGGEVGPFRRVVKTVDVAAAALEPIRVALQLWPQVPVAGTELEYGSSLVVASANQERWISDDEIEHGAIRIPRDRDIALRARASGFDSAGYPGCLVRISKSAELTGPVRLPPPPEWELQAQMGSAEFAAGVLTILDPAGRPLKNAWVKTNYGNSRESYYTDDSGQVASCPAGASVTVEASRDIGSWATLRSRLQGEGPWTLSYGNASVRIEVRDAAGNSIEWYGILPDGTTVWNRDADVELFGLEPGLHRVLVGADGFRAVVKQFRLRSHETRALAVVLPRR